jgi:hypothetical protein
MAKRVQFCQEQLNDVANLPIIFTDESTVTQDLNLGGIWRQKGEFVPEGLYEAEAHPCSVMVWGAIGLGWRSELIRCPKSVNATSYMQMLADHQIFFQLIQKYHGMRSFVWQQDNAPAHGPPKEVIAERFLCLDWPPHSPDLSPIEMVWAIIKRMLAGRWFAGPDQLYEAIEQAWRSIDQSVIDTLLSSFKPRCQICVKYNGACLNGHWGEVHALHHELPTDDQIALYAQAQAFLNAN